MMVVVGGGGVACKMNTIAKISFNTLAKMPTFGAWKSKMPSTFLIMKPSLFTIVSRGIYQPMTQINPVSNFMLHLKNYISSRDNIISSNTYFFCLP